ncbi:MAG: Rieske 2Fe-2S domain-containing protein [Thaumarchaeota archaeon]|nr:Rieske 2Fe-2S domain-containing protein [Nitrososphaerota archaeon]
MHETSNTSKVGQESFVTVAADNQVPEGTMFGVAVAGNAILLSKIGGKIYAMDAVCSHYYGYLPKGSLRDHTVVCPVHKAEYDIATGKVTKNVPALMKLFMHREATDVRTYEVEVVDNNVRVKV